MLIVRNLSTLDRREVVVDPRDAFAEFLRLNVADGDASPDTIRAYKSGVRAFYDFCQVRGIHPANATEYDVMEWRRAMVEDGLAPSTINLKLCAVRRFFAAAVWRGIRPDNPAEGLKAKSDGRRMDQYLTQGQLGALFHAARGNTLAALRDRLVLAMGALQGLRSVEIVRLRPSDIREQGGHPVATVRGKTGQREVYLRPDVLRLIEDYLKARAEEGLPAGPDDSLIISLANGSRGQGITRGSLRRLVSGYLDTIGVTGRANSTHLLRHSYATITLAAGAELRQVQESMGHSDPRTTARYAHATERAERNPALFIEEVEL